jgi:hypothetical protein
MYDVATRDIPARSVLSLKRTVAGAPEAWAFGTEFVSILRRHHLPMMEGRAGAVFSIYWGAVSDDSDGPVEWCRPIPTEQAERLAVEVPELVLRREPAHREAFVHLGRGGQIEPARWQLIAQSMDGWVEKNSAQPSELGARITYLSHPTTPENQGPDCDFAIPIT